MANKAKQKPANTTAVETKDSAATSAPVETSTYLDPFRETNEPFDPADVNSDDVFSVSKDGLTVLTKQGRKWRLSAPYSNNTPENTNE